MYGHVITKFSRMGSLLHFLTHGSPLRARELRYKALTGKSLVFWISGRLWKVVDYEGWSHMEARDSVCILF